MAAYVKKVKQTLNKINDDYLEKLKRLYRGEEISGGFAGKIINAVKIFIVSIKKFYIDDCFTKASSITYTIILSLIPALTVALTIYSVFSGMGEKKKELFERVLLFMMEHNIKMNIDPIFDAILSLIDNAGKIGGISAALMIFSATAMLRSMEKSMNDIWKIKIGRPILMKVVYYWAALTLGPIMLIAGTTVASQVSTLLSSPNYHNAAVTDAGRLWIVGNKSTILSSDAGKLELKNIVIDNGTIDFENQKVYRNEYGDNKLIEDDQQKRIEFLDLKKTNFTDVQFIGDKGWIIGNNGIMLQTVNAGRSWSIKKFASMNFNDICMLNENKGFIVAESGAVLSTKDGGASWTIEQWEGQTNFTSVEFYGEKGIITGSRGTILETDNGGKTWTRKKIDKAKRRGREINLNSAFFVDEYNIWLVGNEGVILSSNDGGNTWSSKIFKEHNYFSAFFFDPDHGSIVGDNGTVIRTENNGQSWETDVLPTICVNALLKNGDTLWALGDAGTISISKDHGQTWELLKRGKLYGYIIINFMAPFAIIWLLFLLMYITLPYTRVPFKAAALGASFTGAIWVGFILGFIVYVKAFAQGTFAIYGALSAIPLSLLMIYASSLIILFGAEVAYTLQYPETYRKIKKAFRERDRIYVYNGIALLQHIYRTFERGKGASFSKDIRKAIPAQADEINLYAKLFLEDKLIIQNPDGSYIPANSSNNILVNKVMDSIMKLDLEMPVSVEKSMLRQFMSKLFNDIGASRTTLIGDLTLKDLIDKE